MITHSSQPGPQYLRKLLVLPLAATLILLFAFNYKNKQAAFPAPGKQAEIMIAPADTSKPGADADQKIFVKVEEEAAFTGGISKWKSFLESNLNAGIPAQKGAPAGSYSVIIQFVVYKDGSIGDTKALTHHGYGMEAEALRVIRKSPAWTPARQNGKSVSSYRKQPITFLVSEDLKKVTETDAVFPGGDAAWTKYLEQQLNAQVPVDNKAPAGIYKVLAEFMVDKKGNISYVNARTTHGYGMEQELLRIIKNSPKWTPGTLNGKPVNRYHNQPVIFQVGKSLTVHGSPAPVEKILNEIVVMSLIPGTANTPISAEDRYPSISLEKIKAARPYELLELSRDEEIIGFMFTTDLDDNRIGEAYSTGNQFSAAAVKLIQQLRPGRMVTIDLIRIRKDGKEIKMPSKVYMIVS